MLNLPSKTPGDRLDYAWIVPVGSEEIVTEAAIELRSGDAVIEGQSLNASKAKLIFVLSGGSAGTNVLFYVKAQTNFGNIIDDTIAIYISGAIEPRPTPADIKADFPEFANVDDAVIQRRIDRTGSRVDAGWGSDFTWAKELLTAHYLVEDGFGSSDAEIAAYRAAGVSRLKSGNLEVFLTSGTDASAGEFDGTSYGRRFYALMKRLFSGPLTTGSGGGCIAGAATDVPWAWRAGGFGL